MDRRRWSTWLAALLWVALCAVVASTVLTFAAARPLLAERGISDAVGLRLSLTDVGPRHLAIGAGVGLASLVVLAWVRRGR